MVKNPSLRLGIVNYESLIAIYMTTMITFICSIPKRNPGLHIIQSLWSGSNAGPTNRRSFMNCKWLPMIRIIRSC